MTSVYAPYGFVPLNDEVFLPDWADSERGGPAPSQDVPYPDGCCGVLTVEVKAHTPLFVRGAQSPEAFFRGSDGLLAIPGSSLRGAVRNVLEIASFGWMRRINDHRYGVRDLQNQDLYVRHMAGIMDTLDGKKQPVPKVMAGWLRRNGDGTGDVPAHIRPVDFAKIEYRGVMALAKDRGLPNYAPGTRQSAVKKYTAWGLTPGTHVSHSSKLQVEVEVEDLRPVSADCPRRFGKATGRGKTKGTLVFTGQPSPWDPNAAPRRGGGHPKHHDFVFYGAEGPAIEVDRQTMEGFEFVHGGGQERHSFNQRRARNDEWKFWGADYDEGHPVPVFFLLEGGKLRAFGLAMMFRLAYKNTTRDAAWMHQKPTNRADLAETLFGHVPIQSGRKAKEEPAARKGRVSIGMAHLHSGGGELDPVRAILGAPKASYYPAYVEQDKDRPGSPPPGGKDKYKTFMDADARIRGFKRYRPHLNAEKPPPGPQQENTKVWTTFKPIKAGTTFRAKIRLHNVREMELGGLLWALDFGQEPGTFHTLGMARSLGYGRCTFSIVDHDLRKNNPGATRLTDTDLQSARSKFTSDMHAWATKQRVEGGWTYSRRIFELVELAKVLPEDSPHRFHMRLESGGTGGGRVNEFVQSKKDGLALPAAGNHAAWMQRARDNGFTIRAGTVPVQARPGSTPPPRSQPGRPPAPPPAPVRAHQVGWKPIAGGTEIEVEITDKNKKGRWVGKILEPHNQGHALTAAIAQGVEPPGVEKGQRIKVIVVAGGDKFNLGLKWKT